MRTGIEPHTTRDAQNAASFAGRSAAAIPSPSASSCVRAQRTGSLILECSRLASGLRLSMGHVGMRIGGDTVDVARTPSDAVMISPCGGAITAAQREERRMTLLELKGASEEA